MPIKEHLKYALESLESLPAMPVTAQKLLALPLDSEAGEKEMLNLIGQDPQIYGKVIGMANSPMMGVSRKISSVQEAAMILGLSRVKSVAIGIASLSGVGKLPVGKFFDPNDLWLHSMTIAMVMRNLAQSMPRKQRPNEDQIFLTGLLHDIGFMALHFLDTETSDQLHKQLALQPDVPIIDVEMEVLGMTHCYIGAQLAKHWHLPDEIVTAISFHHLPYASEVGMDNPLVMLISIAERLVPDFCLTENTNEAISDEEWEALGIDPDEAEDIGAVANEIAMQSAQVAGGF